MIEEEIIEENRRVLSVEEIDAIRKKNVAYEYLCHLEEAKLWLEAVLLEPLPNTTELEEFLRNGVCLAKLGHFIAPDVVPVNKIFDFELRKYKRVGLLFSHTDNINYWLKALVSSGLPKTFHPETTDVYDKKGMPKVIYCIHALSNHLFKLGRAPLIQDLYGKVKFTDAEICNMNEELQNKGTAMPAFQKIGNYLTKDIANDAHAFYSGIVEINESLNKKDPSFLLHALGNPVTKLHDIEPKYALSYWNALNNAKHVKVQSAVNRSASESFTSDIYDELLTQAEIQGHVTSVNVSHACEEVVESAFLGNEEQLLHLLHLSQFRVEGICDENVSFYLKEILSRKDKFFHCGTIDKCRELQNVVNKGNQRAQHEMIVLKRMEEIASCLMSDTPAKLLELLSDKVLDLQVERIAAPLYFEELKADLLETRKLVLKEVKAVICTLNHIAAVTKAVDSGSPQHMWDTLCNPSAHFSDLDFNLIMKYWQALHQVRQAKLIENFDFAVLTYEDIQDTIDSVNELNENNNQVIQVLNDLNDAVISRDDQAVVRVLQNPILGLYDNVSPDDSLLYLKLLERKLLSKKGGGSLWLEDVEATVRDVLSEVQDAQNECAMLSEINSLLKKSDVNLINHTLKNGGFHVESVCESSIVGLRRQLEKKEKSNSPWVCHLTKRGNTVFLNLHNGCYSWKEPDDFSEDSRFLTRGEVEMIMQKTINNATYVNVKLIIRLQSLIRGYLVRRSLLIKKQDLCATKIQAWWRCILQKRRFNEHIRQYRHLRRSLCLEDKMKTYEKEEEKIIKIQAIWRGRQARKAFVSLFHQTKPSFKVVKQFAFCLNVNEDDYTKDMHLQNLKAQVTKAIRHNQQLAKQLDAMDIKIGLLVQNRISLQDVVAHSKNLNDLAVKTTGETMGLKGLKSLTKDSRKRLEGYQHLFYILQTSPVYLAKLLFCLPKDRTSMFIKTFIWSLFNFGTNSREEYLLLRLFQSALVEEVRINFSEPSELISSTPLVLTMVAEYARQAVGPHSLQNTFKPLVQKVLDDKSLIISTNPVDIYKNWRNQEEMKHGVVSELPPSVSPEQALSYLEVQKRLAHSIQNLKTYTAFFLNHITGSVKSMPYGLLYMARVLREALEEKFPSIPEKDILKVVGNLLYYLYINPALINPDTFGIISVTADCSLTHIQRHNLASIAKILQFSAVKKGFGEESRHLMCLNSFIIECHKSFKVFFRECCDVEDLDSNFSLHQYSEATLISRPVIYISLQEICDTHKLLVEYLDKIAPDPMDPLVELLEDMGPPPTLTTLIGRNPSDSNVAHLAKTEVCLILVNKYEVPEEDETDVNKLFIKTKKLLVSLLPGLKGEDLLEALCAPETKEQEILYSELVQDHLAKKNNEFHQIQNTFCVNAASLSSCKTTLRQYLAKLELKGLVTQEDHYQAIITAIAHDICNRGKYNEIIRKELQNLLQTKLSLDVKTKFYEEQVSLYNQYIDKCLKNLNTGKRNIHRLKNTSNRHKVKSKLILKYSATRLHEKGILVEVDGLPTSQFKNMQFEISPSDENGIFTICGRFMGVSLEKVDVDIQKLLQLQFEGESVINIFDKAKVNVNLLLHLLNKKFYGRM